MKKILLLLIFIMLIIPTNAESWSSNSTVINGIYAGDNENSPCVFDDNGQLKLIIGKELTGFTGWEFNNDIWISNSSIVNGLSTFGSGDMTPSIWNDSGTWKLLSGEYDGTWKGWYWNGSTWIVDVNIINGVSTQPGYRVSGTVFYHDSLFKLITTDQYHNFGYYWNGTSWISDSSIVNGLGVYADSEVFINNGILKIVVGKYNNWNGFQWNETNEEWVSDSSIVNGLGNVATYLNPTIYQDGNLLNLLVGYYQSGNGYIGYSTPFISPSNTISIEIRSQQNSNPLSTFINDIDSTGGFTDANGYRTLTPNTTDSKEYTIFVSGEELYDGLKLTILADSADVEKLTVNIEDLDSSKSYDVFFDYEPVERIRGVSEIQYDITSFSLHTLELVPVVGVNIYGTVYNATSNETLSNANVSLLQNGIYYNTTTDANGDYSVTNLSTNILINVNVIKSGYTHEDFSVTPLWAGNFKMDLYMFSTIIGVHGLVVDYPWHQAINGSTVWLWNATYNTSTATTSTGYYLITNITNGNYTMNASATGYIPSDDVNITVVDNVSVEYFILSQVYNLTVTAVDSQTEASIQSFSTTAGTETIDATNGSAVFSLGYGLYYVVVTATGYYPSYGHAFLDKNETLEIELKSIPIYYESHKVKFTVKSLWGTLYSGVDVNAYLGDTITQYNHYLNGTTGTDGAVVFLLTKDVQYTLTFIDESQSIDETITLYPVDNEYTVYTGIGNLIDDLLNPDDEEQAITAIDVSVSKTIINDNTANITVNYNDIMDETSGLTLTLSQSIAGNTTNKTVLSTVDLGTTNNTAYNFTVTNYNGESYLIEIEATHTTHGAIYRMYGIQFENTDTLFGFTVEVVGWLAIIFVTWFALTATSITVPHTAIGVCTLATVMMAIGWGSYISVPGLGLAWIMTIGANMAHAKEASA